MERGKRETRGEKGERVRDESNVHLKRLFFPSPLFNVLVRQENGAFISPASSSVIREEEERREDRPQQREGGGAEVVCSTRIKHWEMVPCEKMADQKS